MVTEIATAVACFIIGAAVRPFLGGYGGEKGKRLATHEDFEQILAEQHRTTKELESIKAEITDTVWRRQRGWDAKKQAYVDLLAAVSTVISLFAMISHGRTPPTSTEEVIERMVLTLAAAKIFIDHPGALAEISAYETNEAYTLDSAKRLSAALIVASREDLRIAPPGVS